MSLKKEVKKELINQSLDKQIFQLENRQLVLSKFKDFQQLYLI